MKCEYCDLKNEKSRGHILYKDKEVVVAVKDLSLLPGQVTVFPTEHYPIMEFVPDSVLEKCSIMANKVGIAVFEALGVHGTNVIIQNGISAGQKVPHFGMEIVPRMENDDLDLQWTPKPMSPEDLDVIFDQITSALKEKPKETKTVEDKKEEPKKEASKESSDEKPAKKKPKKKEENYLLKSLKRRP